MASVDTMKGKTQRMKLILHMLLLFFCFYFWRSLQVRPGPKKIFAHSLSVLTAIFQVDLRQPVPERLQSGCYWS